MLDRLEVLFWGVRAMQRLQLLTVDRLHSRVEHARQRSEALQLLEQREAHRPRARPPLEPLNKVIENLLPEHSLHTRMYLCMRAGTAGEHEPLAAAHTVVYGAPRLRARALRRQLYSAKPARLLRRKPGAAR